jgi:hypothetical protein
MAVHLMKSWVLGVAVGLLTASTCAQASSQTGRVADLVVRSSDGLIYLNLEGPAREGRPPCASNHAYWMIRDENSGTGKRQYAMLLTAKATGRRVFISGTGQCTRWADGEDIDSIQLLD